MGTLLYEVPFHFRLDFLTNFILFLILLPLVGKREKERTGKPQIFLGLIWCFILMLTVVVFTSQLDLYRTVTDAYRSGQYQVVEGHVENFKPLTRQSRRESFDIDSVHFSYTDSTPRTGYHQSKYEGGVITGDGQHLKIGYIYYDSALENVIVSIESFPAG